MAVFSELYGTLLDYELGSNDSAVLFLSAKRKSAINEGLRQFADLTECWVRSSTITCSNGVGEYNLYSTVNVPGGDFVRVYGRGPDYVFTDTSSQVSHTAGDDLLRRDIPWLDAHDPGWQSTVVGTPETWYLRDESTALYLGLVPPPDISTSESAKVVWPYVARPSSLTSDTNVPFGGRTDLEPYHQAAVHYAASKLEKLRKDRVASESQMAAFMGYVQRFLMQRRPRGGQVVRFARGYFHEATRRGGGGQIETADT